MAADIAAVGRPPNLRWKMPRTSAVIAVLLWHQPRMAVKLISTEISAETDVVIAADCCWLSWLVRRDCLGQKRDTCRGHNRSICRGSTISRGTPRERPRISTVAVGNTHGSLGSSAAIAAELREKVKYCASVLFCQES